MGFKNNKFYSYVDAGDGGGDAFLYQEIQALTDFYLLNLETQES